MCPRSTILRRGSCVRSMFCWRPHSNLLADKGDRSFQRCRRTRPIVHAGECSKSNARHACEAVIVAGVASSPGVKCVPPRVCNAEILGTHADAMPIDVALD